MNICQALVNNGEKMEGYFLFRKSKTNGQKKIISLIAKTKTNRPGKTRPEILHLIPEGERGPAIGMLRRGRRRLRVPGHVVGDLQGEMGVNRHV